MVQILYIISCCFEKVYIYKPETSRPANSEKYLVCLYYKDNLSESAKNNLPPNKNRTCDINNLDSNTLQRKDVILVRQEIYRLKQANTPFFRESRQIKARCIEKALLQALEMGCEDVIQDFSVRKELARHRIFSFWGLKKTTSILNIDTSISSSISKLETHCP